MKLEIYGKNYNPSDSLKAVTEKKCEKLSRHFKDEDAIVKFAVTLESGVYTTDLTVVTHGQTYRAEAQSDSPFDNLDVVIPRILGQFRKLKSARDKSKRAPKTYEEV